MMRNLEGVRRILLSPATTLEGLASAVGLTAEELFHGVNFDGVDLTDERVEHLARIDADYTGAILSRRQRRILNAIPTRRRRSRRQIAELRAAAMRRFIEESIQQEHHAAAVAALIDPLLDREETRFKPGSYETRYAELAVQFVAAEPSRLRISVSDALERLLGALRRARMPIGHHLLDGWPSEPTVGALLLQPERLRDLIDFDLCTVKFVTKWLDGFEMIGGEATRPRLNDVKSNGKFQERRPFTPAAAASTGDEVRGEALLLAVEGPSRPPAAYLEEVLGRARSAEELRDLAAAVRSGAMDQAAAAAVARMLAQGATNARAIAATLSDERLHPRVSNAFRRLLVAAGTPEGRRALLETIAELGERASGLEVDAVVAGLSFDETMQMLRPYWARLTPHHRNISRTALLGKATSPTERSRVGKL